MKKKLGSLFGSGGSIVRVSIAGIIIAVIIVSFYYYLSHRLSSTEEEYNYVPSQLEEVINQDFLFNYPETPKRVVEWYNKIQKLYYSDEVGDNELELLCDQARMLLDQEILAANTRDNFIVAVKQEKQRFKERGMKISSATVVKDSIGVSGRKDVAGVVVLFSVQERSSFSTFYQTYNLRKDGAGRYKIYSFAVTDKDGNKLETPEVLIQ